MIYQLANIEEIRPYKPYRYDPEPKEWQVLDNISWEEPIIIEVGCGQGKWILDQAQKYPHKHYIGIERTINKSNRFLHQAQNLDLENLTAVHADATPLICQKVPDESVEELYFFYPNPTPKKRQANQRFFVGSSFQVYHNCLKPNGKIYLASNIADYVWEAKQFLEKIWDYKIVSFGEISKDLEPRTAFETKYKDQGQTLHELIVKKPS